MKDCKMLICNYLTVLIFLKLILNIFNVRKFKVFTWCKLINYLNDVYDCEIKEVFECLKKFV